MSGTLIREKFLARTLEILSQSSDEISILEELRYICEGDDRFDQLSMCNFVDTLSKFKEGTQVRVKNSYSQEKFRGRLGKVLPKTISDIDRSCSDEVLVKFSDNIFSEFFFHISDKIGVKLVPIISREYFSEQLIRRLEEKLDFDNQEGYVVRLADSFHYDNFALSVAKYVRPRHVQTSEHWMKQPIVNNLLAG